MENSNQPTRIYSPNKGITYVRSCPPNPVLNTPRGLSLHLGPWQLGNSVGLLDILQMGHTGTLLAKVSICFCHLLLFGRARTPNWMSVHD
jgi:hypothetical protein